MACLSCRLYSDTLIKNCCWYQNQNQKSINNKRDIQKLISSTLEGIYDKTPIIKNELINRNNPSAQANAGRRKSRLIFNNLFNLFAIIQQNTNILLREVLH
jgi:hypothetical protein